MDKVIRNKWIKALRSGRYKQTTGELKNEYGEYCAVGVLCNVINHRKWRPDCWGYSWGESEDDHQDCNLPASTRKRIKLTPKQEAKITDLNDNDDLSFNEIADYIEAKL